MLKIKSAQTPKFHNGDVERVFGHANNALLNQQDEQAAQLLNEKEQELMFSNPYITLKELMMSNLGDSLRSLLGSDHWVFNPNRGIVPPDKGMML
jgi:hypothetical protein